MTMNIFEFRQRSQSYFEELIEPNMIDEQFERIKLRQIYDHTNFSNINQLLNEVEGDFCQKIEQSQIQQLSPHIQKETNISCENQSQQLPKQFSNDITFEEKNKKQNLRSDGKNSYGNFAKACRNWFKKHQKKLYQHLMKNQDQKKQNIVIWTETRANIASFFIAYYHIYKKEPSKIFNFINQMKKKLKSYNKKREKSQNLSILGNISANQKIIQFLNTLLKNIQILEQPQEIKTLVSNTCYTSRKQNNKKSCLAQIEKLYDQLKQSNYTQIFQG